MSKCIECNKELDGQKRKFCSQTCRNKNKYDKNKEVYNANSYEKQVERAIKRKLFLIDYKGGCCSNPECGYNKNMAALEFHHLDPNEKDFGLNARKIANTTLEKLKEEVDKCILLCSNCHKETHNPDNDLKLLKEQYIAINSFEKEVIVSKCETCGDDVYKGNTKCATCSNKERRKVDRPSIDEIINHRTTLSWAKIGKLYGVSDNTVRKWVRLFGYDPKTI